MDYSRHYSAIEVNELRDKFNNVTFADCYLLKLIHDLEERINKLEKGD